jgi:cellulose synthase/poly-beta-1,6-N-acetylglucosamine synthase-like glycosyltransferase
MRCAARLARAIRKYVARLRPYCSDDCLRRIRFCYFIAFITVHTAVLILAALELARYTSRSNARDLRRLIRSPLAPPISVLVPGYNEAAGIADSVRSLLALEYPVFEVVVINDGSTDGTVDRLIDVFDLHEIRRPTPPFLPHRPVRAVYAPRSGLRLLLIDKENGGKADSLNAGINFASYPLVCAIDADSILEQDALAKTVMPFFEDPTRTIATGGLVRVANGCVVERGRMLEVRLPQSKLAMFQVVEYLRAFFGSRTGWSYLNGLLIVSGAFGLFRREAVIAAGGYRTDIVGEDIELVVRLHRTFRNAKQPYRIVYVADPVCWTEAPETTRSLHRQRRRWSRGSIETLLIHRGMMFNPRYRAVGLLALPALLMFEVLGAVIELSGYATALAAWLLGALAPASFALFLAFSVLYGMFLTLGSIALEDASFGRHSGWDDLGRVLLFAVGESLGYRQLGHLWRIEGFWQLIRKADWGAMERKGFADPAAAAVAQDVGPPRAGRQD